MSFIKINFKKYHTKIKSTLNIFIILLCFVSLSKSMELPTSLIQLDSLNKIKSDDKPIEQTCKPKCDINNGLCYNNSCYCLDGYIGDDCSVTIDTKGLRISLALLILIFVGLAIAGILIAYLFFITVDFCCCQVNSKFNSTDEIDLIETWEKK